MIYPEPVTAAMATVRLRDSVNGDIFRETYSIQPSIAHYSPLHQITSYYISLLLDTHSLLPITFSLLPINTSRL